ncbi:MAG: DUF1838 family protein [Alphaproteobacteria bacterium]
MRQDDDSKTGLTRRAALQISAVTALGTTALGGCAQTQLSGPGGLPVKRASKGLDLTTPEDNVYAIVKIQGDLSGKVTQWWGQGNVFGIKDGEMATPLLRYQSARIGTYTKQDDGSYLFKYRGMILYQDYETGEFIDEFKNPYTGEKLAINHYKTSLGSYSYTLKGPKSSRDFVGNSGKPYGAPYVLPWIRGGERIWCMLDERVEYERPRDKEWRRDNALLRYEALWDELDDPTVTSVMASSSFQTHIDWFTWLNMKGHSGGIMQGGMGRKFKSIDDFPSDFLEFAERKYPGFIKSSV